jgi:transcriptional regulator with XRE-family HTH domain
MKKAMIKRAAKKSPSPMGARLAALRQQAGLSQAQLAEVVGIPQRTISFYETEAGDLPSTLIPALADALGVSLEELLGVNRAGARKRGPKSQLERQLEAVAKLPRAQQQRILEVVQALIAQHQSAN